MSQRTAEKFHDFYKWYSEHNNDHGGLEQRLKFLEKAVDILADTMTYALEDIADLEGRPRESVGRRIWTAGGMKLTGDLTRFG